MPTLLFRSCLVCVVVLASGCGGDDGSSSSVPTTSAATASDATASTTLDAPVDASSTVAPTIAENSSSTAPSSTAAVVPGSTEPPSAAETDPVTMLAALSVPDELGSGYVRVDGEGSPPPQTAWQAVRDRPECSVLEPIWNTESVDKLAVRNTQYVGATPVDTRALVVFALTPAAASAMEAALHDEPQVFADCWQTGIGAWFGITDLTITDMAGDRRTSGPITVVWRRQLVTSQVFSFEAPQVFALIRRDGLLATVTLTGDPTDAAASAIVDDLIVRFADAQG